MYPTALVDKQPFLQLVLVCCLYAVPFQIETNKGAFVIIFFICRVLSTQPAITFPKLTIEALEQGVKCLKLTIKALKRCQWRRSGVFIINFEYISHFLVFSLFTLNR